MRHWHPGSHERPHSSWVSVPFRDLRFNTSSCSTLQDPADAAGAVRPGHDLHLQLQYPDRGAHACWCQLTSATSAVIYDMDGSHANCCSAGPARGTATCEDEQESKPNGSHMSMQKSCSILSDWLVLLEPLLQCGHMQPAAAAAVQHPLAGAWEKRQSILSLLFAKAIPNCSNSACAQVNLHKRLRHLYGSRMRALETSTRLSAESIPNCYLSACALLRRARVSVQSQPPTASRLPARR